MNIGKITPCGPAVTKAFASAPGAARVADPTARSGTPAPTASANRASAANSENRGLDPKDASKLPIPGPLAIIESKVNNVVSNSTGDLVVKTYPNTTHAKTVEMVVTSKAELQQLYSKMITLYTGFEVEAVDGASVEGSNGATAVATAAGSTAAKMKITQIGGVLFTLE